MQTETPTTYRLDKNNCILSVSGPWDEFAQANNGLAACASRIQGRLIWDFISGDVTRMWVEALLQLTVVRQETMERTYRCDSPDLKRFMRMRIIPEESGILRVDHALLSVENRINPVQIRPLAPASNRRARFRCGICGRIEDEGTWVEPDAKHGGASGVVTVLYTVCQDCMLAMPDASSP
jgi:hypothetical protein